MASAKAQWEKRMDEYMWACHVMNIPLMVLATEKFLPCPERILKYLDTRTAKVKLHHKKMYQLALATHKRVEFKKSLWKIEDLLEANYLPTFSARIMKYCDNRSPIQIISAATRIYPKSTRERILKYMDMPTPLYSNEYSLYDNTCNLYRSWIKYEEM